MTRLDISDCGRTVAGDVVAFSLRWEGEPGGDLVLAVRVTSPDGAETVELGYALGAGEDQQYVEADGRRQRVDTDADLGDGEITARFPAEVVGVAIEWPVWTAVVTADGQVVAEQVIPTS
jgi:hypothetical protein